MRKLAGMTYHGFGRYLFVIASRADEDAFLPVLQQCRKKKYRLYWNPEAEGGRMLDAMDASSAVMVFVSNALLRDDALMDAVAYASCSGKPLIGVHLEALTLTGAPAMLLRSRQALLLYDYESLDAFYEKLFSSRTIKGMTASKQQIGRRFRLLGNALKIVCLSIAAAVLLLYLLLTRLMQPLQKQTVMAMATPTPQPSAAVQPSQTHAVTPLPGTPLTVEELSEMQGIYIVGDTFVQSDSENQYKTEFSTGRRASIGSLEDVTQFSNLTNVRLYDQSGTVDISPLFRCKSLRRIYLRNVTVASFAGIEDMEQLCALSLINCATVDLAPLTKCDFSFAKKESGTGGFRLVLSGTKLKDAAVLGEIAQYQYIQTDISAAVLAPILQNCKQIDTLVCENVAKMRDFGQLSCVKKLIIHDDRVTALTGMEGLSNLESLEITGGLTRIGTVRPMPKLTSLKAADNPIRNIDGIMEAFPNLKSATFSNLSKSDREALQRFTDGNA